MDAFRRIQRGSRRWSLLVVAVWIIVAAPVVGAAGPVETPSTGLATPQATGWQIETLDVTGDVGRGTALALDSLDRPHIAYRDQTNGALKYAVKSYAGWLIETVPGTGIPRAELSLQLDSADRPHISFGAINLDGSPIGTRYAYKDGALWHVETVEPYSTSGTSLAIQENDEPCLAYGDSTNGTLKYACRQNGVWTVQPVDADAPAIKHLSMALDLNGQPRIAFQDSNSGPTLTTPLSYASWTGTDWTIATADPLSETGGWPSLKLDSAGNPHISHYTWNNWDLKYTVWTGSAWETELVYTEGMAGSFTSLMLANDDRPLITFFDLTNQSLRLARHTGAGWDLEIIDSGNRVGEYSSAVLSRNQRVHVSYYDATAGDLKYAVSHPPLLPVRVYLPLVLR